MQIYKTYIIWGGLVGHGNVLSGTGVSHSIYKRNAKLSSLTKIICFHFI